MNIYLENDNNRLKCCVLFDTDISIDNRYKYKRNKNYRWDFLNGIKSQISKYQKQHLYIKRIYNKYFFKVGWKYGYYETDYFTELVVKYDKKELPNYLFDNLENKKLYDFGKVLELEYTNNRYIIKFQIECNKIKRFIENRNQIINQEIIKKALHPKRISSWLNNNFDIEDLFLID